jgi:hypothetical protein
MGNTLKKIKSPMKRKLFLNEPDVFSYKSQALLSFGVHSPVSHHQTPILPQALILNLEGVNSNHNHYLKKYYQD